MSIAFSALKYATLPGLKSRISELFMSGFQYVPYFIALVYHAVRLLPANHPYLNPANFGRYGIRHVIGEAANNLVVSKNNIDQIILFVSILIGLVIVIIQVCLLAVSLFFQPAFALGFGSIFLTPPANQATDLASMMMDMIFGVPGIFNSCVSTPALCTDLAGNPITSEGIQGVTSPLAPNAYALFPFPLQQGLHRMFQLYSTGLLVVGAFIMLYFIITVTIETAQTGTPFGKRFNKIWTPLRIVAAFGLLIPVSFGLNSAQYIVLYTAKLGSGFATNGWNLFNETLTGTYLGDAESLVAYPQIPELSNVLRFFYVARTCYYAENASRGKEVIKPYLVRGPVGPTPQKEITENTPYSELVAFAGGASNVTISFGELGDNKLSPGAVGANGDKNPLYGLEKGFVKPICGQIKLNLTDSRIPGQNPEPNAAASAMQEYYWKLIKELWFHEGGATKVGSENYPQNLMKKFGPGGAKPWGARDPEAKQPDAEFRYELLKFYNKQMGDAITKAIKAQIKRAEWDVPKTLRQMGWAGAGIWYNRIAEMNGPVTTSVFNIPEPSLYPGVMEFIRKRKQQNDQEVSIADMYEPKMANGEPVKLQRPEDIAQAPLYSKAFNFWQNQSGVPTPKTASSGNVLIDAINLILGTDALFSMRKNVDVNPLAQLVGIGRSLVEATIRNLSGAALATLLQPVIGQAGGAIAGLIVTIGMITLTAGFVLFYVIPFLPFLYFFFAIGRWFKTIFEAMLGTPLWALSHLRLDNENGGFIGQASSQGYFLIFEIFLRPILIVFGLLASISIFTAMVTVMNGTFDLVIDNLTGNDHACDNGACGPTTIDYYRGTIDQFFYTVVYAVLVYITGISSFKLIDQIPASILRWMGSSAQTFTERDDDTQGLLSITSTGAQQTFQQLGGGLSGLTKMGGGQQ